MNIAIAKTLVQSFINDFDIELNGKNGEDKFRNFALFVADSYSDGHEECEEMLEICEWLSENKRYEILFK